MRATVITLSLAIGSWSCSANHLPHPLTQNEVLALIADALYGVDYACYSQWLNGTACTITYHILNDATAAVAGLSGGWQVAAKNVLVREEQQLPADSRIRPYLDAVISVL
jgi:hypothetical protein